MKRHHHSHQHSSDPVRAKKHLGQHFLKDQHTAAKIADTLLPEVSANVLEIGPGTGVLTAHLLKKNIVLKVMELDSESVTYLQQDFKTDHLDISEKAFEILEADFLKFDLNQIFKDEEFSIIGNFPYNISSQIVFKTIENRHRIPVFSGMFQKEVAQRICEKPGSKTYGILSVLTQAFYEAEYLFTVPPAVFSPPPKVDSGVLRLIRKDDYSLDCDEELFFKIVKLGFQQRRKTLRNSLKSFNLSDNLKEKDIFGLRPERLSVADFAYLTQLISQDS